MPLDLFYTMVQKSQKWPKTQIKGSCLNTLPIAKNSFHQALIIFLLAAWWSRDYVKQTTAVAKNQI